MRFEFDPAKDRVNHAKHGVSLSLAIELDWEAGLVWIDGRYEREAHDRTRAENGHSLLRRIC